MRRTGEPANDRVTQIGVRRHRGGVSAITLEEAYEKWADELVGYATAIAGRSDAADVVAEAFAGRSRVHDTDGGDWHGAGEPRAYLFRCVLNTARMRARSAGRRRTRELRVSSWGGAVLDTPESLLGDPAVRDAIDRLSAQQRASIYLTYWDDMSPQRVADTLDLSVGTVKRHLARARASLRKALS